MQNRKIIVRIIALALIAYALMSYNSARIQLQETQQAAGRLQTEYDELHQQAQLLEQALEEPVSDEMMEQLARDRLGMVLPQDKIFEFITDIGEP